MQCPSRHITSERRYVGPENAESGRTSARHSSNTGGEYPSLIIFDHQRREHDRRPRREEPDWREKLSRTGPSRPPNHEPAWMAEEADHGDDEPLFGPAKDMIAAHKQAMRAQKDPPPAAKPTFNAADFLLADEDGDDDAEPSTGQEMTTRFERMFGSRPSASSGPVADPADRTTRLMGLLSTRVSPIF